MKRKRNTNSFVYILETKLNSKYTNYFLPTHHQPCLTLIKKYKKLQYEIEPHSIFVLVIGRALLKFLKVETPESVKLLLIAV